jgi:peptidoglycan/xylan/chitin deacetylase (PgdA/CDA1 family)
MQNALAHEYLLKAVLSLVMHDRFVVHGDFALEEPIVCISYDCDTTADMESIPSLLDILAHHHITTSFALFGNAVVERKGTVREILGKGHEIINHTFSHPGKFREISPERMAKEVASFQKLMESEFCYRPQGFRAPHLMRKYNRRFFCILHEHDLYDSSYVGRGVSVIDDVVEIALTECPDHPQLCFDYWHHFQLPIIRSNRRKFLRLWENLLQRGGLVSVYFDPHLVTNGLLSEIIGRVPDSYKFCQVRDIAQFRGMCHDRPESERRHGD